ncbi:hypothetical protein FRB99_004769 [Tulasnella sp. 403]|nr:hypothetical protein FRB99_004769 [Tulasnella sp. 403]
MPHQPILAPHFFALNLPQTVEFYTRLGFTHLPEVNQEYDAAHATLFLGPTIQEARAFILFYAYPSKIVPTATFHRSEWTLKLDDGTGKGIVDTWFAKWVRQGAEPVEAPADKPWGIREAKLKDPNGHTITLYFWPLSAS